MSGWIPCQERMPEPEDFEPWERVLVLARPLVPLGEADIHLQGPMLAYLDTGGREDRWREDGGRLFTEGAVTHWMRIPGCQL